MTEHKNLPSHTIRPCARPWKTSDKLKIAQGHSTTVRKKEVSLETPPWEKEKQND